MDALNIQESGKRYWEVMCSENRWVERAADYDQAQNMELRSMTEDMRREMYLRHAEQATKALGMANKIVEHVMTLIDDNGLRTVSLVPRTITQETERGPVKVRSEGLLPLLPSLASAIKTLQQAERTARGDSESTTNVQVSGTPGGAPISVASTMTEEQQEQLFSRMDALVVQRFGNQEATPPDPLLEDDTAPA